MVLGEVEEIVTTVEIEDETLEEIIKVRDFCTFFFFCFVLSFNVQICFVICFRIFFVCEEAKRKDFFKKKTTEAHDDI